MRVCMLQGAADRLQPEEEQTNSLVKCVQTEPLGVFGRGAATGAIPCNLNPETETDKRNEA